jgi:hypothetical protein
MTDYLGDIKSAHNLIERIKDYYRSLGIPLYGVKFVVEKELDQWGTRFYSIRSNMVHDVNAGVMRVK